MWERRAIRRINRHYAHDWLGSIRNLTAIDRNPKALCEVTEHRRFATRSDHSARWRLRRKAMRHQLIASTHAADPVLSPKDHRSPAGGVDDGSNRGAGVKRPPGRAAARTMADHGHHRGADGLETYRATCANDRCHWSLALGSTSKPTRPEAGFPPRLCEITPDPPIPPIFIRLIRHVWAASSGQAAIGGRRDRSRSHWLGPAPAAAALRTARSPG